MLFYQIFQTPITLHTKKEPDFKSSGLHLKRSLLEGRIFEVNKELVPLGNNLYRSLLETAALRPKKKHFKRILAYIFKTEEPEDVDPEIIDMIVEIAIANNWPILMGGTIKFMVSNDFAIKKETFDEFCAYLDRCKGYEKDADKFRQFWLDTHPVDP